VPVSTAIAAISSVAAGAISRGATFDAAKIGLAATLETMQSANTIETRRTTGDVARRGHTGRKVGDRSSRRTADGTSAQSRRRTTGTEAWRRTSEHGRRTWRRAELRQSRVGRYDDDTEQRARGKGEKGLSRHCVYPSV
jgi:hypothetical protein